MFSNKTFKFHSTKHITCLFRSLFLFASLLFFDLSRANTLENSNEKSFEFKKNDYLYWKIYTDFLPLKEVSPKVLGIKTHFVSSNYIKLFALPTLTFFLSEYNAPPLNEIPLIHTNHQLLINAINNYIRYYKNPKKNKKFLSSGLVLQEKYLLQRKKISKKCLKQKISPKK